MAYLLHQIVIRSLNLFGAFVTLSSLISRIALALVTPPASDVAVDLERLIATSSAAGHQVVHSICTVQPGRCYSEPWWAGTASLVVFGLEHHTIGALSDDALDLESPATMI